METFLLTLKTVTENPDDRTAAAVAYDAGQEAGFKPLTARRKVNKAIKAGWVLKASAIIHDKSTKRKARLSNNIRHRYRRFANVDSTVCPVVVIAGKSPPRWRGEPAHFMWAEGPLCGTRCYSPARALMEGWHLRRRRATYEVFVGAEWVLEHESRPLCMPLSDAQG